MKYYKSGNTYAPMAEDNIPLVDRLPVATYSMKYHPDKGFYLEMRENFTLPPKMYGSTHAHTKRILNTAASRNGSTGILLSGEKGSGKTLLSKNLSLVAMAQEDLKWPTIIIDQPYGGPSFLSFIHSIDVPCVILFDEFEKMYPRGSYKDDEDGDKASGAASQDSVLTLLEGASTSKKLYVLTVNDRYSMSDFLKNRPGRLYYSIDFTGLDAPFIREYCADRLENTENTEGVVSISYLFNAFNFDMLQALVEEMNRYGETAQDAVKLLNIKPFQTEYNTSYKVTMTKNGKDLEIHNSCVKRKGTPLASEAFHIHYVSGKHKDGSNTHEAVHFAPKNLVRVEADGTIVLKNGDFEAKYEKEAYSGFDYDDYGL